jgi:hypothetical protein
MSPLAGHPLGNVAGGRPNATPVQRPCRVGYAQSDGWYTSSSTTWTNSGTPPTGMFTGGSVGQGNRLCTWSATVYFTDDTPPNPIPSDRDPGFWANIYGPGQYAANGDAFSTRCTNTPNCSTVQNVQYRPTTDPNRGEWYVVEVPPGVSGTLDINVFDASLNIGGFAPDITDGGSGTADFETEYRVFTWNSTLDFNNRGNAFTVGAGTNVHNDGSCWWELRSESDFDTAWSTMCTRPVSGGERFLVNVRTNAVTSANNSGNNGYAMEAVINDDRYASPGPSIYAYRDMVISNNNECPSGTCEGTFYLAKVDPIYAGRTLVLELFDAGDSTGASVSTVYPMMPSPTLPRPVVNVPASDCTFTATPAPNAYENSSNLRIYSGENRAATTATAPDSGDGHCGIRATISNTRQYNGMWLRIRVDIPTDYACDRTVNNPEVAANSCWWGIRYRFNGNASDTTTWQARVEGNPLQLTE